MRRAAMLVVALLLGSAVQAGETVWLSSLDLGKVRQGWGKALADQAVTGKPLRLAGQAYEHGVGTHARSVLFVDLDGKAERFQALCGVDDAAGGKGGSVVFRVTGDGKTLARTGVLTRGKPPERVDVDLRGVKRLVLIVEGTADGIDNDHADWADAKFLVGGQKPRAADPPKEEAVILTPPERPEPRINGPKVYGVRPNSPFLYSIAATGERPMTFAAEGLPEGLTLDPKTGFITGTVKARGKYPLTFKATNPKGTASRPFTLVCGDTLALTPHMGWNSWYAYEMRVTDKVMREAADALIKSGLARHGYEYVNIDDGWANKPKSKEPDFAGPVRDSAGKLVPNRKFPDMKAMTDYIHARGLKAGIYTSPGPTSCGGQEGAWQHEEIDARTFAEWGFDFLKYDWCSYGSIDKGTTRAGLQKPYRQMGDLLKKQPRDLVLNLCQYGMGNVWEWGKEVGGHSWRTAGDFGINHEGIGTRLYSEVMDHYAKHDLHKYGGPGGWNDPDYILIGPLYDWRGQVKPTSLTPNEQYTHVTLWALVAAPFILGGDVLHFDPFTLSLLTNDEVIDVDQDSLGKPGRRVARDEDTEVWARDLEDGGKAVGLFNRGEDEGAVTVRWADLGVTGKKGVRDLWRQKDLGEFEGTFTARVPRHGVVFVKVR